VGVDGLKSSQSHINQVPGDGSHIAQEPEHARNVNERVEAVEGLSSQAQLLDAVGQPTIATYLQGKVLHWNRCAEQLFASDYALELTGYTPEELTDGTVMFASVIVE
jgi:PAS domain-containing protein